MARDILGNFAMMLRGVIQARNVLNGKYEKPVDAGNFKFGLGGNVDDGKTGWLPSDITQPVGRTIQKPALTAFYDQDYPDGDNRTYTPTIGLYPAAVIGMLTFEGKGIVSGALRGNSAGVCSVEAGPVTGGYQFDDISNTTGVISLQFVNPPFDKFIWDYFFVWLSIDELLIMTGNQVPRPAVATGTLRRMGQK
jgi:hypothetical protein